MNKIDELQNKLLQDTAFIDKLNKKTYSLLLKSKKILNDTLKQTVSERDAIKALKIQLYCISLTLEEINEDIIKYMENKNE